MSEEKGKYIIASLLDYSGAESEDEILDQWESERGALESLHDENQALVILNKRLLEGLKTAEKMVQEIEKSGTMFIPGKVLGLASLFRAEMDALKKAIAHSKELTDEEKD